VPFNNSQKLFQPFKKYSNLSKVIPTLLLFSVGANAKVVEVLHIGKTYPFAEEDLLVAIHKRIQEKKAELEKKAVELSNEAKKQIINFKPKGIDPLTPADKNSTRIIDLTYTLPFDIKDANGKVIYPKGFKFNPADYVKLSYEIIILNANRPQEVEWFFKSKYSKNPLMYRVFLTDGNWYNFQKRYKHQVFYCLPQIEKRFKLRHTVSIIRQVGDKFEIKEIAVK
jgi:conjugal transfer pilus assembly protein TraW